MKTILAQAYKIIPFKKNVFQFIKFFWTPPHRIYKHLHFTGIIKVKVDEAASFSMQHHGTEIENDFFWKGLTGGWEKISMQYWIQLCRNARVIVDIGANTGVYSLAAKAINSSAKVYAFEPLKQMFAKLTFNNKLNKYDIICIEKAASDNDGKAIIYETGTDHVNAASLNARISQESNLNIETEIDTVTLDTFIQTNKVDKIDLIKIDVETYEPNVLEGYKQFLQWHRPDFLIEVLTDEVGDKLQQLFDGLNYCYFNIDDKRGGIRKMKTIKKSDYFNYLICKEDSAKQLKLI